MNETPPAPVETIVTALYRGILDREPDPGGLDGAVNEIQGGTPYETVVRRMLASEEYQSRHASSAIPIPTLPDLTKLLPEHYDMKPGGEPIFMADEDGDFDRLERLIDEHRYYDSFGVWSPRIDLDKRITAAIVRGLGGKTVFELGCFTGAVLSLLEQEGCEVTGMDVSHLAFVLAYPNVRRHMVHGDLLTHDSTTTYDVVLAMDVLEHLNPLKLDKYLSRFAALVSEDGFAYVNSPMFGPDRVFGNPFPTYYPEWESVGDTSFWRRLHCDALGWPKHGHLVWAAPGWWERQCLAHGLQRDTEIEAVIHEVLADWFKLTHGRKSLFVLKRPGNRRRSGQVAESVRAALRELGELTERG